MQKTNFSEAVEEIFENPHSLLFKKQLSKYEYPFILAVTGAGDCDGEDYYYVIKSQLEFKQFLLRKVITNKMFASYDDGNGMEIEEIKTDLSYTDWSDDAENGCRIDIYKTYPELMDKEIISIVEYGSSRCYNESDKNHRLLEGDLVPTHTCQHWHLNEELPKQEDDNVVYMMTARCYTSDDQAPTIKSDDFLDFLEKNDITFCLIRWVVEESSYNGSLFAFRGKRDALKLLVDTQYTHFSSIEIDSMMSNLQII